MIATQFVQHYAANTVGRDLVVGDIHGCMARFWRALRACEFNPEVDRLFSVGDLVDRGPDSPGALALLENPWFHAVMGNHEWLFAHYVAGEIGKDEYFGNGGRWTESYSKHQLAQFASAVLQLPLAIAVGTGLSRFNVLHAEFFGGDLLLDGGDYEEATAMQMLWGRTIVRRGINPEHLELQGLSKTYVGHTIRPAVQAIASHVFIDTGSYKTEGCITIIEPATGKTWDSRQRTAAEP